MMKFASAPMALLCAAAVCFFVLGADSAEWYSFVSKWPDVPQAWRFASPFAVAADSSGNVFVADTGNHKVKRFDSSGKLTAEWGSYGSGDGEFKSPRGIAVDSSGNVFVVDTENFRVQKFDSWGNFLGKWGSYGSGDGQFAGGGYGAGPGPIGIGVNSQGNVFVTDTENHRIQRFNSEGKFLGKWGSYGTADGKFSCPHGIAVDKSGNIFVADTRNHRIQWFDSSGAFMRKWGTYGSGNGEFMYPRGIAVDSLGGVFVADTANTRVERFDSLGNFKMAWGYAGCGDGEFGGGAPGVEGPSGIAVDFLGNVFVADTQNDRIQKFGSSGNFLAKWGYRGAGNGEFNSPAGIAMDSSGKVFVVDRGNHRVECFDASGNFLGKWGAKGTADGEFSWPFAWPPGITVDSRGSVYVADTGNSRIQKFDLYGNFVAKWSYYDPGSGAPLQPCGLAVDLQGNVFVSDAERCNVVKFDASGNFLGKWGSLGSGDGGFLRPYGIAVDSAGNVYVVDTGNHRIQRFDSVGNFLGKWGSEGSGDGQFRSPCGIAVDPAGNVYVADSGNHRVEKFDSSGKFLVKWGSQGSGDGAFNDPRAIAADSSGNVYVSDSGNHRVEKFRRVQPVISVEPESLSVFCNQGEDAPSGSIEVWNGGGMTLTYTVSDDVAWLSCNPNSGSSEGERDIITVSFSTASLPPGMHYASIAVSDPGATNSPKHVDVTLTVRPRVAEIGCQPTSLSNSCEQGQNASSQTFEVWNAGRETLSYVIADDVVWLFCNPASGTSTGERDVITVSYNTRGLQPGSYSARITVSDPGAANNPQHIEVSLTVLPRASAIGRQPASLFNSCEQGENASSQSFEVWNAGGGTLYYMIGDNAEWVSCSPAAGTSTGEHDTVIVSYDSSSLEPGNYSGTITVWDPAAVNSPQTISVSLTVHPTAVRGIAAAGSATTTLGDLSPFAVAVGLDLPYDLTYLAITVKFPADAFSVVSYARAGRVVVEPAPDGINNNDGEVHIAWLSLTGETVIPAGSGSVAIIQFKQSDGLKEGTYPVTPSDAEATYGPESYHLKLMSGQIRVIRGSLDVDRNGAVEPPTDIVYIYRYLVLMPAIVPSRFRQIDPFIPSDGEIKGQIDALGILLDVDRGVGPADAATDVVYIYRHLVGMPKTVPSEFRRIDPSIPPDNEINARIDAINIPSPREAALKQGAVESSSADATANVLKVAHVTGQAGGEMVVPIILDAAEDDLSYMRLWLTYDSTKLTPRLLRRAGRAAAEPMADWLDEENKRIRAVVESLTGDVAVPKGYGPVVEVVFDVISQASSTDSTRIYGEVEAGLGPKKVSVTVLRPAAITFAPTGFIALRWEHFGTRSYTVVYCDDLQAGAWTPAPGTDWPIGETSWQGENISGLRRRFYRVKSE